jgi:hypothetical protein
MNVHINENIKLYYKRFGAFALTLMSFGISFAKIIKILIKLHETVDRCVIKSMLSLLIYHI